MKKSIAFEYARRLWKQACTFLKWMLIACLTGVTVGAFSSLFAKCMTWATSTRQSTGWVIYFLPVAGLLIVFLYQITGMSRDRGTNRVIQAANGEERVPLRMAPLIFISTVLTHLCGGSAGREGAALQMGGSLGDNIARLFRLNEDDQRVMVMCGMSAAFSALFGTPMAAAIFPLEMVTVGILYYSALVPCVFAAFVASRLAFFLGVEPETFTILDIPAISFDSVWKIIVVGIGCAAVAILFCEVMHVTAGKLQKWIKNPYVRAAGAGVLLVAIAFLLGTRDYMGAGMDVIERAMEGQARPEAFLIKMVVTAITLGAGFKGGEIVPSFFVGATFGCVMGQVLGLSPSLCAAVGLVAVFCGVTNSPITSMFIAFELFGFAGDYYFLLAVTLSYALSGHWSLYQNQSLLFTKFPFRHTRLMRGYEKEEE